MYEKFGEFDSVEEINRAAAAQLAEGDIEAIIAIALENGIDKEDAEDYADGCVDELATPIMAAIGKLKIESEDLKLKGVLLDWADEIKSMCIVDERMAAAVRRKGKSLAGCMSALIGFSFENKVQVSSKIVSITKVNHNGKLEALRGPLYMGIPNRKQVKEIVSKYYLG